MFNRVKVLKSNMAIPMEPSICLHLKDSLCKFQFLSHYTDALPQFGCLWKHKDSKKFMSNLFTLGLNLFLLVLVP